jgi:hypothetical protein
VACASATVTGARIELQYARFYEGQNMVESFGEQGYSSTMVSTDACTALSSCANFAATSLFGSPGVPALLTFAMSWDGMAYQCRAYPHVWTDPSLFSVPDPSPEVYGYSVGFVLAS